MQEHARHYNQDIVTKIIHFAIAAVGSQQYITAYQQNPATGVIAVADYHSSAKQGMCGPPSFSYTSR